MQIKDFETTTPNTSIKNAPLDMLKWQALVEGWDATSETQVNYCKRLNINLNTFSYVRTKLLQKEKAKSKLNAKLKSEAKFIPISLKQLDPPIPLPTMVVENKAGMKLILPAALPADQLLKVLKCCGWSV
jgi:hypothetical protein